MAIKTTSFGVSEFKKNTPIIWRKVGDAALLAIPMLQASIMQMPITEHTQKMTCVIIGMVGIAVKFLCNCTSEE